jgi:hypothetical protein
MARRWRLSRPGLLAFGLGLNLWATLVAVPALYGYASPLARALAPAPLFALLFGCLRPGDLALYGLYPAALAGAAALAPEAETLVERGLPLFCAGLAWLAYLWAAARAIALRHPDVATGELRVLEPSPGRRTPRVRVARGLVAFVVAGPAVLLAGALRSGGSAAERPGARALSVCAAAALWTGLCVTYVVRALPAADLQARSRAELRGLERVVLRGRAGATFYALVAGALVLMAVLVYLRYR